MKPIEVEDYEIELDLDNHTALVHYGHFQADLHDLERTGEMKNHKGRIHRVPAWMVGTLVNTAYANGI